MLICCGRFCVISSRVARVAFCMFGRLSVVLFLEVPFRGLRCLCACVGCKFLRRSPWFLVCAFFRRRSAVSWHCGRADFHVLWLFGAWPARYFFCGVFGVVAACCSWSCFLVALPLVVSAAVSGSFGWSAVCSWPTSALLGSCLFMYVVDFVGLLIFCWFVRDRFCRGWFCFFI